MRCLQKTIVYLSLAMVLVLTGSSALAVVSSNKLGSTLDADGSEQTWVRGEVSQRAQSEVQVKRLKNMLARQQISTDDFFDRIQTLIQSSSR